VFHKHRAEGDPEASEIEEGSIGGEEVLMANQESAELTEPGVGAFDDPASFVTPEFSAVLVAPELAVLAVGNDEVDASLGQPFAQRIGVVGAVGDHPFRLLPRPAFGARDFDFGERGFRKRNFSRRGTFQPNSQRKTATVDQYHPLRALATLGFTDCGAPFFAGAKLPSRNVSSHFSRPSPSSAPSNARHASSHTSCSSHCFNRRQQVAGEGYLSGKNLHAAPGLQHPQDALQAVPAGCPWTPSLVLATFRLRQQRLDQLPLRLTQQLESLLAHARTSSNHPPHTEVPSLRPNLFMKHALGASG
jgi:hypothetical protein